MKIKLNLFNYYFYFLIATSLIILLGCEKKFSNTITSFSPDKKTQISIYGYKNSPLSSSISTLKINHENISDSIEFEFYNDQIDEKYVSFLWGNDGCKIQMTQTDGKLNFEVGIKDNKITIIAPEQDFLDLR